MVILNAPTYFSAMWGIIKQMIDPRTAKRIQVFSSATKGKARLLELIDSAKIPSDYGGTGPSLDIVAEESSYKSAKETNQRIKRIIVEPIQLKRKGGREYRFTLACGELGNVKVYTRSSTSAKVSLHRVDSPMRRAAPARALFEQVVQGETLETTESENTKTRTNTLYGPLGALIGSKLIGPATFVVSLQDLGHMAPSGVPSGQFVIISEVS